MKKGEKGVRKWTCPDVGATPHDSGGVSPAASVRRGTRWANCTECSRNGVWHRETPVPDTSSSPLLDLDGGACLLELGLDLIGFFLVHALLDRLGSRVDEVLGLLETKTGDRAHDLDHLNLLLARSRQDDVERGLLLRRSLAAAGGPAGCRDRDRSGGGDAPLLFDLVLELDQLEHGHAPELLEHRVNCCHV